VKNPWKTGEGVDGIEMYTPFNQLLKDAKDPNNLGFQLDFSDVGSCTAKGYPAKGCIMALDVKKIFDSLQTEFKAIMGVKVNCANLHAEWSCPMLVLRACAAHACIFVCWLAVAT
jgi:hypothetical protein